MTVLALANLIVALGAVQDVPAPQDRWIAGASPLRMIVDPCDSAVEGEEGLSISWVRRALLVRGHPRDMVCRDYANPEPAPDIPAAFKADLQDLAAQVVGRSLVMIGSMSRPLDDDGSWGPQSEAGSRALYVYLKADDYRALRELQAEDAELPPTPR